MKSLSKIFIVICILIMSNSCITEELTLKKEDDFYPEQIAIPTEVKGNINDHLTNSPAVGQEVEIIKKWNKGLGYYTKVIATVITDINGNYSYRFDHKDEQYKTNVYYNINVNATNKYSEYSYSDPGITKGGTGIMNVKLFNIVTLKLNLQYSNNINGWLDVGSRIYQGNSIFALDYDYQRILEPNGSVVLTIRSLANVNFQLIFIYRKYLSNGDFINFNKNFNFTTTSDNVQQVNYIVDCATFTRIP